MNMKKVAIAVAVIVVLGAGGIGTYAFLQRWAARQVDAVLAQPPFTKAEHGAVRYLPWRGRVELDALAVETSLAGLQSFATDRLVVDDADFSAERFAGVTATNAVATWTAAGTGDGAGAGTVRTTIAEMHVAGLNLPAWRAAAQPASGDAPPVALVDGLTLAKMTSVDGSTTASVDSMTITDLKARTGTLPSASATADEWVGFLGSVSVAQFEMAGVAVVAPDDQGMTLARLVLGKVEPGKLGHAEAETLTVKLPRGTASLGSLTLDGLVYRLATAPAQQPRAFVGRLRLADIVAGPEAGAEVSVKELLVTMDGSIDNTTAVTSKVTAIDIPAKLVPSLTLIGYDDLVLAYEGDGHYDLAQGKVDGKLAVTAPQAGNISLSFQLSNYPNPASAQDIAALTERLAESNIDHLELRYDDASLVDRLFKYHADRTHRDVDAARADVIARFAGQRDANGGNAVLATSLENVGAFLRRPGTITLTLAPPQPMPIGAALAMLRGSPEALAEALGLSIH